jgi:5-methylcytosine-specific restriction endonuclease McrBC regulatory subunit McrC
LQNLIIPEYGKAEIPSGLYDKNDLVILTILSPNQKNILFRESNNNLTIQNRAFAGLIQLSHYRLQFGAKVEIDLMYMLHFLKREDIFCYDPAMVIDLEAGDAFFDFLGKLFLRKLTNLMQEGLTRRYLHQEENQSTVRGSINFSKQWENQVKHLPKISCCWDALTYDIRENQLLLQATRLLISTIWDESLRFDLKQKFYALLDYSITFVDRRPKVMIHRLNKRYQDIMPLVLLLLERSYIHSERFGLSKGFNFLVNMNRLFEDLVTSVVENVIKKFYPDYQVLSQVTISDLVKEGVIDIRPDILLKNGKTGEIDYMIDAKYKVIPDNSNYYQMIAYSLAIPTVKRIMMIFPESENGAASCVTVRDSYRDNREVQILCQVIPLAFGINVTLPHFIRNLEGQMKIIIAELMNNLPTDTLLYPLV